jgi:hypothetical protein
MAAKKKTPENARCLSITREAMQWTTCIHVRIGERCTEFNDGEPYAAHPKVSGDLNLGGGSLGLTAYINTERGAGRSEPSPLNLNHAKLCYRDLHILEGADLRDMARTVDLLGKRLDKLRDQLGYAQDFGEHIVRLAAAVDAKWIALDRKDYKLLTGFEPPAYGGRWIWTEVRDARRMLDAVRDHHLPHATEPLIETARQARSEGLS